MLSVFLFAKTSTIESFIPCFFCCFSLNNIPSNSLLEIDHCLIILHFPALAKSLGRARTLSVMFTVIVPTSSTCLAYSWCWYIFVEPINYPQSWLASTWAPWANLLVNNSVGHASRGRKGQILPHPLTLSLHWPMFVIW